MIHTELSPEKIDTARWLEAIADPAHGAELIFRGVVRDHNHGRSVRAVNYDAFVPLCRKVLEEICQEACARHGGEHADSLRVALIHRVGRLEVGEASVLLAVSSRHRAEAYAVGRAILENLKIKAPIWKKEIYADGESEWLQGHALCGHAGEHGLVL